MTHFCSKFNFRQTEADLDLADSEREAGLERITERNIVLLLEDIVQRCQGIFIPASTAVVRRIEAKTTALIDELSSVAVPTEQHRTATWVSRERLVVKVRAFLTTCELLYAAFLVP